MAPNFIYGTLSNAHVSGCGSNQIKDKSESLTKEGDMCEASGEKKRERDERERVCEGRAAVPGLLHFPAASGRLKSPSAFRDATLSCHECETLCRTRPLLLSSTSLIFKIDFSVQLLLKEVTSCPGKPDQAPSLV